MTMRACPTLFIALAAMTFTNVPRTAGQETSRISNDARHAVINTIRVIALTEELRVEIAASGPLTPQVSRITKPDRLVFDFEGAELRASQRFQVNHNGVASVRVAQFRSNPPVTRVVVDMDKARNYEEQASGNTVIINIKFETRTAGTIAPLTRPVGVRRNQPKELPPLPSSEHVGRRLEVQPHAFDLLAKAAALTVADLQMLENRAESGDAEAETTLALAYHSGLLLKRDNAEAVRLLHQAADQGFVAAQEALGILCEMGIGGVPNPTEALAWYKKAAEQGSVDAATSIALIYAEGKGVAKDITEAQKWFRQAAIAGGATAQYNLAGMHHRGEGVAQDETESVRWLMQAANQNFVPAILHLARRNVHSAADMQAATLWYEKAADLGDAYAQAMLGDIFADGIGVKPDFERAITWYRKAAEQGNRDGEFGLGIRYLLGQGVPADSQEARRWFAAAAEKGHADAQYDIGVMNEFGRGSTIDLAAAVTYYRLAADQGNTDAQFRLGLLLARGAVAPRDPVSAYKWLVIAEDSVGQSAAAATELRKSMSADEVAQAESQVDTWRITHPQRGPQ